MGWQPINCASTLRQRLATQLRAADCAGFQLLIARRFDYAGWDAEPQVPRVKFDLFYQLPSADSQNPAARYRELVAEAVEADRLGFDTLWLAEVAFHAALLADARAALQLPRSPSSRRGCAWESRSICSRCIIRCAWPRSRDARRALGRASQLRRRARRVPAITTATASTWRAAASAPGDAHVHQAAWIGDRLDFRGRFYEVEGVEVIPNRCSVRIRRFVSPPTVPTRSTSPAPMPIRFSPVAGESDQRAAGAAGGVSRCAGGGGQETPEDWLAAMFLTFPARTRPRCGRPSDRA